MSDSSDKLVEGLQEALAVARGEQPAARLHIDGHSYVSTETMLEMASLKDQKVAALRDKACELVDLMLDAEINHGGLIGTKTLRARDELRLELARWK